LVNLFYGNPLHVKIKTKSRESEGRKYKKFSQIIWATSNRVGCGAMKIVYPLNQYPKKFELNFICNYGPAGSLQGSSVYIPGEPGTNCQANMKLGVETGLCVAPPGQRIMCESEKQWEPII